MVTLPKFPYELFPLFVDFPKIVRINFFNLVGFLFFFFCEYLRLPHDFLSSTGDSQTVFISIGTPLASFARTQNVVPSISLSSFQDRGNPPDAMLHDAGALKNDIEDIIRRSSDREHVVASTRSSKDRGGIRFLSANYYATQKQQRWVPKIKKLLAKALRFGNLHCWYAILQHLL